jgi:signal peptidase II
VVNDDAEARARKRAPARLPRWIPVTILLILVADQATKAWAVEALAERDLVIVAERLGFTLTRNSGASFSMLQGATALLAIVACGVAVVLWRTLRRTTDRWLVVALVLVFSGALGNLADRFFRSPGFLRGHVVDFVKVWPIPIFNVADSCITVGAILLVARSLFTVDEDSDDSDRAAAES